MDIERETRALRRLARALVVDPAAADDLVQDTWLAAVRNPPANDRPVRPWLARVLRNRAHDRRVATHRSRAREAVADPPSAAPSLDQFQTARQLFEEIEALPEVDRELVMLRYWEGLTAVECATRLNRPPSTVRTQLQRALGRLRERLDRRRGGRSSWMAAMLPLAKAPAVAPLGAAALGPKALTAGGVVAASIVWLAVANTHGCGVGDDSAPPESAVARSESAVVAKPTGSPAAAPTRSDNDAHSPPLRVRPIAAEPMHPKLAAFKALRGVEAPISECADAPGSTRCSLTIRSYPDGRALFDRVEFSDTDGLTPQTLECVRQTILARELDLPATVPLADETVVGAFRMDLRFDQQGKASLEGVSRGPATRLVTATKRGRDLDEAVDACGSGEVVVTLTFDPESGSLAAAEAESPHAGTEQGDCVAAAALAAVRLGRPFEPEAELDASVRCTFGLDVEGPGRYTCVRLGPDGGYVDVD